MPPLRAQRRPFGSTRTKQRPQNVAAVTQKVDDGGGAGWARFEPPREVYPDTATSSDLQHSSNPRTREDTVRRSLENQVRRPIKIAVPPESPKPHDGPTISANNPSEIYSESRNTQQAPPNRDATGPAVRYQPGNTKHDVPGPAPSPREDTEYPSSWRHVRRRAPVRNLPADRGQNAMFRPLFDGQRRILPSERTNEEQARRMERSKDGSFVGLEGLRKARNPIQIHHERKAEPPIDRTPLGNEKRDVNSRSAFPPISKVLSSPGGGRADASMKTGQSRDAWTRYKPEAIQEAPPARSKPDEIPLRSQNSAAEPRSETMVRYSPMAPAVDPEPYQLDDGHEERQREAPMNYSGRSDEEIPSMGTRIRRSVTEHVEPMARPYLGRSYEPVTEERVSRAKMRRRKGISRRVDDDEGREFNEDEYVAKKKARIAKSQRAKAAKKALSPPTPILLPEFISVSNLAGVLKIRVEKFLQKMTELGFDDLSNDHVLDAETAGLVAAEYNFEPIIDRSQERDLQPLPMAEDKSLLPARPPVVTIMGHVDHGKTTMLDFLRKSSVAASEHGGITQHIGAFSVSMSGGRLVTFLDTPGHAAFLSMRQRGANVTDIVILVVAADDSVKPQTIEAIKHAQAAQVPMVVAVNKIDKEDSNPDRVKQDLARYGVEVEDYGGETQAVLVSGKTGQGLAELEDNIVALADILDVRAETDGSVEGWVLEATTKQAGRVATVLVRRGTLKPGDVLVAGTSWARVRSLRNEAGALIDSAGPGMPAEVDGWRDQPIAGDEVLQAPDEQKAKDVTEYRQEVHEREQLAKDMTAVNEARRIEHEKRELLEKAKELAEANPDDPVANAETLQQPTVPSLQEVFFIVKADVSGSVEAVTNAVSALGNSEIRPHILRTGVGPISEFDLDHAAVAKGHIINFNTAIDGSLQRMAEAKGVKILDQSIIYRLVDDVKKVMQDRLPPLVTQHVTGEAEIGQIFEINIKGRVMVPVAGCRVRNGEISRKAKVRVLRDKEVVYDGMA